VAGLPRELLDGLVGFAAGVRGWPEWRPWFAGRARQLARILDRSLFEQLKRDPEGVVGSVLRNEGVTVRLAESRHPDRPDDPVTKDEYEIYAAVCQQTDLLQFDLPDTVFEDETNRDSVGDAGNRLRLEFDEARREYRAVRPELSEAVSLQLRLWFQRCPEMVDQYEARNQRRWPLERRFEVENGFRFVSELGDPDRDVVQGAFCLSRVGFSADGQVALAFIRYANCCAYYLVFKRSRNGWERAEFCMSWVT
jgi:hypothetical protein